MVEKWKIVKWQNGRAEGKEDLVAEEALLRVKINKNSKFDIIVTPENIKEFIYGNLLSEGLIKSLKEIKNYNELKRKNIIEVEIEIDNFKSNKNYDILWNYNILASDCSNIPIPAGLEKGLTKIRHNFKLDATKLTNVQNKIKESSELYRATGAFHYALLLTPNLELEFYCYDISRHNAIDKVIGKAMLNGVSLEERILFTTGRITSNAVLKCLRAKIPFIISRGACLLNAIKLAKEYDLGVIGFLRGNRFNIYSGENYIELQA